MLIFSFLLLGRFDTIEPAFLSKKAVYSRFFSFLTVSSRFISFFSVLNRINPLYRVLCLAYCKEGKSETRDKSNYPNSHVKNKQPNSHFKRRECISKFG